MGRFLDRLGRAAARRPLRFALGWLAVVVLVVGVGQASGGTTFDAFTIPGAQSQTALDLLEHRFPARSGASATVVFHVAHGSVESPAAVPAIAAVVARLRQLPHVGAHGVEPPTSSPTPALVSPRDARIALATVQYDEPVQNLGARAFTQLEHAAARARAAGIAVAFGGPLVDYANQPPSGIGDELGLLVAVFILVLAFGSIVAAGLPIGTALMGLAIGLSGITILAAITDVGTVAPKLGEMIGLGVGIDYSLFILTRYREGLAEGRDVEAAVGHAVATAGQAVLFAGTTVVIAICGLQLSGIPYVAVLGFAAAIVVAVMMLVAVTLLPALLGWLGPRVDAWSVRRRRAGRHAVTDPTAPAGGSEARGWARWASTVARHPWPFAAASVIVLLTLGAPFLSIRYGQTDDGSAPAGSTQRSAFDLVDAGFGPGANGPLLVVVTVPAGGRVPTALTHALTVTPGVAEVAPPTINAAGDTAVVTVVPKSAPDAPATTDLVGRLRGASVPSALRGLRGVHAYVGGITAAYIDLGDRIADRLPIFIGGVVLLSFVLLMLVFHSVVIPATAALMNLLSVGAAYGVTVAVFQWGWAKSLFGLASTVPIVSFVPMMMFAILFGLSMDYQVFLLTRVREEYDASGETRAAVVNGLARTARVITSAALIMITVFMSFVANPVAEVKMFGLGLAVAVAVDATVVRMVLVPALMEILGKANWWFPRSFDRVVPRLTIE